MSDEPDRLPDRPGDGDPGRGRRLGIDVGTVRIGVALSDPDGILATPLETVARSGNYLRRLRKLTLDNEVVEIVVGLPRTLANRAGGSARDAIDVADELAAALQVPVRMADERLTTVTAQRSLREAGVRGKGMRAVVDQAAAVAILQAWLEARRTVQSNLHVPGREPSPESRGLDA